jgi:hypothetical protein
VGVAMSDAMKSIVDTYVGLKNRFALQEMRQHRRQLRNELRMKTGQGFDFGHAIGIFDEDLTEIEDGIARLRS